MNLKSYILIALSFLTLPILNAQNTAENILGGKKV